MIISSGSSTGAQKAKKLSIFPQSLKGVNSSSIEKAKNKWRTCTKVPRLGQQGYTKARVKRVESE